MTYQGQCVEQRGYPVAVVRDRATGQELRIYKRLGRWRRYSNDEPITDKRLIGVARHLLQGGGARL